MILFVFLEILIASGIFLKSSFITTISDASIAAAEPISPIEIPINALFKTGASLIPSPTKATSGLSFATFSYSVNLSCGNISAFISSISSFFPISNATSFLSPVNIYVLIPSFFNDFIASSVPCFIPSSIIIDATCFPSIFRCTLASSLQSSQIFTVPTFICLFPITYSIPLPLIS